MKKKSIYIIRNTINDKVYIGQTDNPPLRWSQHVYSAKHMDTGMYIHEAMNELGIENFYYQILENDIPDYNEKERYWIKAYHSMYPEGYNTLPGGIVSGFESPSSKLTPEMLDKIIELLKYSGKSNTKIAEECGCTEWTVWAVNGGKAYYNPELTYPIRKSNRYDKELIKQVKYALKYELDKSIMDIAREFHIDFSQVSEINQGRIHAFSNETYPLRKGKNKNVMSPDLVNSIINELTNSTLSQSDIAKKYNVSANCVTAINLGRNFRQDNISYPIRDNHYNVNLSKKTITIPELEQIEKDLMNGTLSMRQIAAKIGCGLTMIQNINNGAIKAYRKDNIDYPIRKLRK